MTAALTVAGVGWYAAGALPVLDCAAWVPTDV